ncbi:serine/threonine-protein kinase HT1 [Selaginella moellendorffii]|nr:serine/threonine-protein kinase HT1 [Selaginella moellendorffii]|eukprot:XP_002970062.2 serine/threonine-protein kinase HT1 [Selaginella moellendorffii]
MARENPSESAWLGRCSFSRSVCHRIDARNIPDLCFPHQKIGKPPLRSRSHEEIPLEISKKRLFIDSSSDYSLPSSNRSSPFASPARTVEEFVHGNAPGRALVPKRVESWSQYLEGIGEVKAVERSEEWVVDMTQLFLGHKFASGAHSRLYHGIYKGKAVAVKVMRQPEEDEEVSRMVDRQFAHEVSLLSRLHHRNIVQFVAACKKPPVYCVVTEYLAGGSLRGFLHKNEPSSLPLKVTLGMAMDIARGMEYIHSQRVIHGDLKSENLVLDSDMCVKITDFGVARCEADAPSVGKADVGTYRWMAPEMISGKNKCSTKVDVYSFGIVLWELVTGQVPFQEMQAVQVAYAVLHKDARPEVPENCPSALAALMRRCWSANPDKRPGFPEIVNTLEQLDDSSSKAMSYNTWHWPSERTKSFLGCFSRCKKCTPVRCNCK